MGRLPITSQQICARKRAPSTWSKTLIQETMSSSCVMRSTIGRDVRGIDLKASSSAMLVAPSSLQTHQQKTLSASSASVPFLTTTAVCMASFRKRGGLSLRAMSLWPALCCEASQSETRGSWSADATDRPICCPSTHTHYMTTRAPPSARRQRSGWLRAGSREAVRHNRIRQWTDAPASKTVINGLGEACMRYQDSPIEADMRRLAPRDASTSSVRDFDR